MSLLVHEAKKIIIKKKVLRSFSGRLGSRNTTSNIHSQIAPPPQKYMCLKKKDRGGNLRLAATLPPAEPGTVEQICGEGRTNGRIVGEERAGGGVGGLGRGGETEPDWCDGRAP